MCAVKITSIWLGLQPEIGNDDIVKVDRFKVGSVSKAWETKKFPSPSLSEQSVPLTSRKEACFWVFEAQFLQFNI